MHCLQLKIYVHHNLFSGKWNTSMNMWHKHGSWISSGILQICLLVCQIVMPNCSKVEEDWKLVWRWIDKQMDAHKPTAIYESVTFDA
jgi:hypothetical protein